MAYTAGNAMTDTDINNLKNRVKKEMARRKYSESLASYATNFSIAATDGGAIKWEHFNETVGYINLISTVMTASRGDVCKAIQAAVDRLTNAEGRPINGPQTGPNGRDCTSTYQCRGRCYGNCITACDGACYDSNSY